MKPQVVKIYLQDSQASLFATAERDSGHSNNDPLMATLKNSFKVVFCLDICVNGISCGK